MAQDMGELTARLNKLKMDYNYNTRVRDKGVKAALKALSEIKPEDVEKLIAVAPKLKVVCAYTEQDLYDNLHGEIATVVEVIEQLKKFVTERLDYLESQL